MATLATQVIDADGLTPTYTAAAAGGDKVVTGEGCFVHYKNGSAGEITVTLVTPGTVGGLAIDNRAVAIGAGAEAMIAVSDLYRDRADDGLASLTYSGVTSLTVASIRI